MARRPLDRSARAILAMSIALGFSTRLGFSHSMTGHGNAPEWQGKINPVVRCLSNFLGRHH